ncbi:SGNH/GDSL hydrolase family protein [Pararhizobium mangrovi]|uniref:Arylesterase n=1 Tax=Pararhizobium mangrovi TaxID=2590452 RepID=A0A506UCN0_9HYPH|nr:SGNH/GDSL hydrolase family protein [Pararhizobium mangrovi]TPW31358.1 arylesterase [Pararhizobium mangrovi]
MKSVLCYGDSLTWGTDAQAGSRHDHADRWPSVLQKALGTDVTVIPEGLGGRTTAYDDHLADCDRNGARILPTILHTHAPLDLVIFMLGTNDMKPVTAGSAQAACRGIERLIELTRNHAWPNRAETPEILIVAPPVLCETADPGFAAMFAGGIAQSKMLAQLYSDLADETGCGFYDAATVAKASPVDGVHLDARNTRAVGKALEPVARLMLGL